MRASLWTIGLVLAGTAALAQPQGNVALAPGEAITFQFDDGGVPAGSPTRGAAEWTPFDLAAARHLAGLTPPDAPVQATSIPADGSFPDPEPIPPGTLRLRFLSIAERHSLLVIENGTGQALVYRARMTLDGETRPTDVCLIAPGQHGFEHWPHPIARLDLTDFRFVPWRPGDRQPCA